MDDRALIREITPQELWDQVVLWDSQQIIQLGGKIGYDLTDDCVAFVCEQLGCSLRDFWRCIMIDDIGGSQYRFFLRDFSVYGNWVRITQNPGYNQRWLDYQRIATKVKQS